MKNDGTFDLNKHEAQQHELRMAGKLVPWLTLSLAILCGTCVATCEGPPAGQAVTNARIEGHIRGRAEALKECLDAR